MFAPHYFAPHYFAPRHFPNGALGDVDDDLPGAMVEDFSAFFITGEFATGARLTPGGTGSVIYDENGTIAEAFGVQTSQPVAIFPIEQWPAAAEGDTIRIRLPAGLVTFVIRSVEPIDDGAIGLITLART